MMKAQSCEPSKSTFFAVKGTCAALVGKACPTRGFFVRCAFHPFLWERPRQSRLTACPTSSGRNPWPFVAPRVDGGGERPHYQSVQPLGASESLTERIPGRARSCGAWAEQRAATVVGSSGVPGERCVGPWLSMHTIIVGAILSCTVNQGGTEPLPPSTPLDLTDPRSGRRCGDDAVVRLGAPTRARQHPERDAEDRLRLLRRLQRRH